MYSRHIGAVVTKLLKQAQDINIDRQISSITIRTHYGKLGPSVSGMLMFKGSLSAFSGEDETLQGASNRVCCGKDA